MNTKPKQPDQDYRMGAGEFDETMRKAFGVSPPKKTKAVPMRAKKDQPKPPKRK